MTPLSQQNAPQVFGLSAASSAPPTPLTTYLTHTSAMPVFFAMPSNLLPTVSPIFPFPGPFLPFCYPNPLTAVLPAPPTTPALPVASSSSTAILPAPTTATDLPAASSPPVSGASLSSSPTAFSDMLKQLSQPLSSSLRREKRRHSRMFTPQEDDLLLQIYIQCGKSKSWTIEAQEKLAYKNLTVKQLENRIYRIKGLTQVSKIDTKKLNVTTQSIIHHARDALVQGKGKKRWTALEREQLSSIYKDRTRYKDEDRHWVSVAIQTFDRTEASIFNCLKRMRKENPDL